MRDLSMLTHRTAWLILAGLLSLPLAAEDEPTESAATEQAPLIAPAVKRYTTQQKDLVDLYPNQALWLDVDDVQIAGLYLQETKGTDLGGILLLPDVGTSCNWPELIGPLRQALPEHGWHTLAITPPMSAKQPPRYIKKATTKADSAEPTNNDSEPGTDSPTDNTATDTTATDPASPDNTSKTYSTHIQSGLAAFQQRGINNAVILGRGEGAYWALKHAVDNPPRGLVIIDIQAPPNADESIADLLANISTPILDAYYSTQLAAAKTRAIQARQNTGLNYRQMHIHAPAGSALAPHHPLIKVIVGWAKKNL